jgi:glycosyltransferase involved in cell wall biosynthesis
VTRIACVIPAFQAAATIERLVSDIGSVLPGAIVIVVNDGSTDETESVVRRLPVIALTHTTNRGKGAALRTGISAALERGVALVITMDADGQHAAGSIPDLVAAAERADIVIGARLRHGTPMPPQRRLSNWLSSRLVGLLSGVRVEDSQSGFRAIRRDVLAAIPLRGSRYELETDLLVRAARRGFRIACVMVPTVYGPPSHFRPFRDTLLVMAAMLRLALPSAR